MNTLIKITILFFMMSTDIMAKNYSKPYYGVELDLAQVGVDIRLNDIPLYYDDQKGQLTVDLPAPTSVINGENELKIIAFPPFLDQSNKEKMESFQPGSIVSVKLYVQEIDDNENRKEILTSIDIQFNSDSRVEVIENSTTQQGRSANIILDAGDKAIVTKTVDISTPFPKWQWENGVDIMNNNENYTSLLEAYKKLHDAYSSNNKSKVFEIYDQRAKETAIAYHLPSIEEGHKKLSTGEDMSNTDLELYTFWEKNMILDIYANGKLARIIGDTAPSIQPIIYIDRAAGLLHKHKLGFYKSDKGDWILIR